MKLFLYDCFKIKDLGIINIFLGMEFNQNSNGIVFHQQKYIREFRNIKVTLEKISISWEHAQILGKNPLLWYWSFKSLYVQNQVRNSSYILIKTNLQPQSNTSSVFDFWIWRLLQTLTRNLENEEDALYISNAPCLTLTSMLQSSPKNILKCSKSPLVSSSLSNSWFGLKWGMKKDY